MKSAWKRILNLLPLFFCLMIVQPASGQGVPRSMESFLKLKPKWKQLIGIEFTLEGRYSSISGKFVRFEKIDLPFRSKDDLPKLNGRTRTAKVSGQILDENGKLYFSIDTIEERSSDLQLVRNRQPTVGKAKPAEWYTLADQTLKRATFYEDDELAGEARRLYAEGFREEYRHLEEKTASKLFALAKKAESLPLPDSTRAIIQHEAFRAKWNELQKGKADAEQLVQFAKSVAATLSGSNIPAETSDTKLQLAYRDDPVTQYKEGDEAQRESMHRLFYSDVLRTIIEHDASEDGSNGFEIAARLEMQLPELEKVAEKYREQEIKYKMGRVEKMSRQEAIDFSEVLSKREQSEQSRTVLKTWLTSREPLLRREGGTGLIKLAEEALDLLDDKQAAVAYLLDAWKLNPNSTEIAERLKKLDFVLSANKWIPKDDATSLENSPIRKAMREGRVAIGMSPTQVKSTLGAPRNTIRIATAGQFAEVWVYGERTGSRLAIHFLRRSNRPAEEAEVFAVTQTPGR